MLITLVHIGAKSGARASKEPADAMVKSYLERSAPLGRCEAESFRTEAAFFDWLGRQRGRTQAIAVLLDSRGKQMSSEALADWVGRQRDSGAQQIVFAIGPADGWSEEARRQAGLLLSFGPMTLAHALARAVMAEQIYRAFTILAGHPYHSGH